MLIKPHTLNKAKLSDHCREDVLLGNDTGVLYNCYSVLRLNRNMEGKGERSACTPSHSYVPHVEVHVQTKTRFEELKANLPVVFG